MAEIVKLGLLHPGQMGAAVAAQAREHGTQVMWCPIGRGKVTATRAARAGLEPVNDLVALLDKSTIVLSICPPAFAEDVAVRVAAHRFTGIYVDANAISPDRMKRIAGIVGHRGAHVVDGAIIGPPPSADAPVRLYLSSAVVDTEPVAALFRGSSVQVVSIDGDVGAASALKMAFASYQKTVRTLAAVAHALAESHGTTQHLLAEANRVATSPLAEPEYLPSVAARAWRWAPEMRDVADTLASMGLPTDLALASATVLERWTSDRDNFELPVETVLARLRSAL